MLNDFLVNLLMNIASGNGQYNSRKLLEQLDIDRKDAAKIGALSISEISSIQHKLDNVFSVTVNRDGLMSIVKEVIERRAERELIDTLLRMDAPYTMLVSLFGRSINEYKLMRSLLGVAGTPGRIKKYDEMSIAKVNKARHEMVVPESPFEIAKYLIELSEKVNIEIRELWVLIRDESIPDCPVGAFLQSPI